MRNFFYGLINIVAPLCIFLAGLYLAVATAKSVGYWAVLNFILSADGIIIGLIWISNVGRCVLESDERDKIND